MQSETTIKYHCLPNKLAKILLRLIIHNVGKDVKQQLTLMFHQRVYIGIIT